MAGPKYTTAFDTNDTIAIHQAINQLAQRHAFMTKQAPLSLEKWLGILLEEKWHDYVKCAARDFAFNGLKYTATRGEKYERPIIAGIEQPMMGSLQVSITFSWGHLSSPFPVPHIAHLWAPIETLRSDMFPAEHKALMAQIKDRVDIALQWGLVRTIFDDLNMICGKGDRRSLRTLLPGVLPLLSLRGRHSMARSLERALTRTPPVPAWLVPYIARVNQIIAGGILLPELPELTEPEGVDITIATSTAGVFIASEDQTWRLAVAPIFM